MADENIEPKPWYSSTQIRTALAVVVVPLLVRLTQHTGLGKWLVSNLGIDLLTIQSEAIVDWLTVAISAVGGVVWIHHRVKAGQPGQAPPASIETPKVIQRFTGATPVQRDDRSTVEVITYPPFTTGSETIGTSTGNLTGTAPAPQIIHTESEMPHAKKNGLTQDELIRLMHERERLMREEEPTPHGEGQAKVP